MKENVAIIVLTVCLGFLLWQIFFQLNGASLGLTRISFWLAIMRHAVFAKRRSPPELRITGAG